MKKSMILACAAMLSFAPLASAQFVGMEKSNSVSRTGTPSAVAVNTGKANLLHVDFLPVTFVTKYNSSSESTDLKGFSVGWAHLSPLGTTPLCFEWGIDMDMAFWSEKDSGTSSGVSWDSKNTKTFLDLKVPFSVAYKFNIPGTTVGLMPLLGFDLGLFVMGKSKYTYSYTYNKKTETEEDTADIFDSDSENKRFIFDFHLGAKVLMGESFFVSYRYELPIAKVYNEGSTSVTVKRHNIGLGFYF